MSWPALIWGSPRWAAAALALMVCALVAVVWNYGRAPARGPVRLACATLKGLGFAALVLSLVEPLLTGLKARRGANAFVVLADNSRSLLIHDHGSTRTRGDWVRSLLAGNPAWKTRLGQDFDVRSFVFDTHLRPVESFDSLAFDGNATALGGSLSALENRFRGLPLAGVLLVSDGNRTDAGDIDTSQLPPIYPIIPPAQQVGKDIAVDTVSVSQTSFESAPAVIRAEVSASGFPGETIFAALSDESGKDIDRQEAKPTPDGKPLVFRFQFRPDKKGVRFYKVRAYAASDESKNDDEDDDVPSGEQTLENNSRIVVVDQGGGPYRVLYVSGRPNWEFKFLRRAISEDEQVQLVGLLRIARKQPKFDFRSARSGGASPLFEGFDHPDPDSAERADQPVLVRLGARDEAELRDGFPKTAEELYDYHAIIIDDLEAAFFTQDQLALLRNFVSQRGGGLLMLGGLDTYAEGKYDRTPVGELLPVYINHPASGEPAPEYRLLLTREGWLQPWVRTRKTEDEEQRRLAAMPTFRTLSRVGEIKPGASVLAQVRDPAGNTAPALVAQSFGKGHVAALLIGDLWRWGIRRETPTESDLDRSWRQTVRWLVSDVPARVDVALAPKAGSATPAVMLTVRVRDSAYRPLDDARVAIKVARPGGETLDVEAEPDAHEAGAYSATVTTRDPGAYRFTASATAPDGSGVGQREAGWAAQPAADEFARLMPDRSGLEALARQTRGELVDAGKLDAFVAGLAARGAPINEPWTSPLWHQPVYFLLAIALLTAEWGLRRVNGLA